MNIFLKKPSNDQNIPAWDGKGEVCLSAPFTPDFLIHNRVLPIRKGSHFYAVVSSDATSDLIQIILRHWPEAVLKNYAREKLLPLLQAAFDQQNFVASDNVLRLKKSHRVNDVAPAVEQLEKLLQDAIMLRASDVHLEPAKDHVRVRFRMDGVLQDQPVFRWGDFPGLLARIKILAGMDIAETRLPQDGKLQFDFEKRRVDIRVSTVPSIRGEDVVLRVLDHSTGLRGLSDLGLAPHVVEGLTQSLQQSHGLILVSGPTGSGKTTTLYAGLQQLIGTGRKIITLEDPVEYDLPKVTQIQIDGDIDHGFAQSLRSVLRHDPDVILVGEIRDEETAQIAVRAAMTGHLVLSTLHTNSAIGAVARMLDMGVPPYLLAGSLLSVTGQRLVRRLCDDCKKPHDVDRDMARHLQLTSTQKIYKENGCAACQGTGYRGRMAVGSYVSIDAGLRQAILRNPDIDSLQAAAREQKFQDVQQAALTCLRQGNTSLAEILRVAG